MSANFGSPGPAKEGIVLGPEMTDGRDDRGRRTVVDAEEGVIFGAGFPGGNPNKRTVRVYRGGWWLPIALGIGIPAMFVFGMFVITALMTVGIVFWLLRSLIGGGGGRK